MNKEQSSAFWSAIDSLEHEGLYQSAQTKLENKRLEILAEGLPDQTLRLLYYEAKYRHILSEDSDEETIDSFRQLVETTTNDIEKRLYQSILGELYADYAIKNHWKIAKRTQQLVEKPSLSTMGLQEILELSDQYYDQSIHQLNSIATDIDIDPMLTIPDNAPENFDYHTLLLQRAVRHYSSEMSVARQTIHPYTLRDSMALADKETFIGYDFTKGVDTSEKEHKIFKTILIYQTLLGHHSQDPISQRLDLERLKYLHRIAIVEEKDSIFLERLRSNHNLWAKYYEAEFLFNQQSEERQTDLVYVHNLLSQILKTTDDTTLTYDAQLLIDRLERPYLSILSEETIPSMTEALFYIEFANIGELQFSIISLTDKQIVEYQRDYARQRQIEFLRSIKPVHQWTVRLPDSGYKRLSTEQQIPALPFGNYAILAEDDLNLSVNMISVSDLAPQTLSTRSGLHVLVTDRKTGRAVPNVTVESLEPINQRERVDAKVINQSVTDQHGETVIPLHTNKRRRLRLTNGKDVYDSQRLFNHYYRPRNAHVTNHIFTDRNLYRPGDLIRAKSISLQYDPEGKRNVLLPNQTLDVILRDPNHQEIDRRQVGTNEYGSGVFDFRIPTGLLTGNYFIEIQDKKNQAFGSTTIKVEEYKRPSFYGEIVVPALDYKLNDTIDIELISKTFTGFPLTGASVNYRVTRQQQWGWRGYPSNPQEIAYGKTITNDQGEASLSFALSDPQGQASSFLFTIEIEITDITGETQIVTEKIIANRVGLFANVELADVVSKDDLSNIGINLVNAQGVSVSSAIELELVGLKSPSLWKKRRYWSRIDTVTLDTEIYERMMYEYQPNEVDRSDWEEQPLMASIIKPDQQSKLPLADIASGHYRLRFKKDGHLLYEKLFQVIDFDQAINPSQQLYAYRLNKSSFEVGDQLQVKLSRANQAINVQYLIEKDGKIISKDWLPAHKAIELDITEEDKGGFIIHLRSVFQNRSKYDQLNIVVPFKELHLDYTIEHFRSIVEPGEQVKWQIQIKDKKGMPVNTEGVWTMYDASLDQLYQALHWPTFSLPTYAGQIHLQALGFGQSRSRILKSDFKQKITGNRPDNAYPRINHYGYQLGRSFHPETRMMKRGQAGPVVMEASSANVDMMDESEAMEEAEIEGSEQGVPSKSNEQNQINRRVNLDETVFFYPKVLSDKQGISTISFKMNDAMTAWKVLFFAHDQQGRFIHDTLHVTSTKDVYISLNKPRFGRTNDRITLVTKIINQGDSDINAQSWIKLIRTRDNQDITASLLRSDAQANDVIRAGQAQIQQWEVEIDSKLNSEDVVVQVGVKHEGGSDILEEYLPIQDDRILVKESKAVVIEESEDYNIDMGDADEASAKLTLELVTDLDWQVIQSLPYLQSSGVETASEMIYEWLANSLGKHIVNHNPLIRNELDYIAKERVEIKAELQKKEEYKTELLKATPWVRFAQNEQKQRTDLLKFLDDNRTTEDIHSLLQKLLKFQNTDGGFSWLPDRLSNFFISVKVLEAVGKLSEYHIDHQYPRQSLENLIRYVDKEIQNRLVEEGKIIGLNFIAALNARSYFESIFPMSKEVKSSFIKHANDEWLDHAPGGQAMLASISHRIGDMDLAKKIVRSLIEQSIHSETLGSYWKRARSYDHNQSSIEQHTAIMEAIRKVDDQQPILAEARKWLLNNKRTNQWENKYSTSLVIFSFLTSQGQDLSIGHQGLDDIEIHIGGKEMDLIRQDRAAFELRLDGELANKTINIKNSSSHPIWASLYKQYMSPIQDVEQFESDELSIEKEIFVKRASDTGPILEPTEANNVHPGDRVTVRLKIKADRSMDFVHIKDLRASGLEPIDVISQYQHTDALYYYQSTKDDATHFMITHLPRGVHILEYDLTVNLAGVYSSGFSTIQCHYAPEFGAHSRSIALSIPD